MSATNAISGKGSTLGYASTLGGSATLVSEVFDLSVPEWNGDHFDATHFASPSSTGEKVKTGWGELSDVSFKLNYFKTQAATIYGLRNVPKYWTITLPDSSTIQFYGEISKLGGDQVPNKDRIIQSATITIISGDITFTAGS